MYELRHFIGSGYDAMGKKKGTLGKLKHTNVTISNVTSTPSDLIQTKSMGIGQLHQNP